MVELKHPETAYPARLARFMDLVGEVRAGAADDRLLWEVMDSVAFADTEAALQTALYNVACEKAVGRGEKV